jgi:hypothetical protein
MPIFKSNTYLNYFRTYNSFDKIIPNLTMSLRSYPTAMILAPTALNVSNSRQYMF